MKFVNISICRLFKRFWTNKRRRNKRYDVGSNPHMIRKTHTPIPTERQKMNISKAAGGNDINVNIRDVGIRLVGTVMISVLLVCSYKSRVSSTF